ncbi:sigma 54-interacting transcriptional regulator [Halomonas sp. PA16-9]|uniref:sigma 54-interacting transcriptional regulator n=1 Tax=Halomonas sp. PA16-9 TaxID=2576841 RepID=UPI0018C51894
MPPILIEGETRVGKELFARAIHNELPRSGSFVPINCGAMSRELMASELFGYEKGAFTGADRSSAGKIEVADCGTLCLDEIGELPPGMQPYLLRVLDDGIVYRIGSHQEKRVAIGLVSMTNRNLANEVEKGTFRQDLFYRIATLRLRVPPLRERGDDVLLIAEQLCRTLAMQRGTTPVSLSSEAQDCLSHYHWPGNVRELRNVLEMSMLMASGKCIEWHDLPEEVRMNQEAPSATNRLYTSTSDLRTTEELLIKETIARQGGNLTQAAKQLGIARSTLYSRLAKEAKR